MVARTRFFTVRLSEAELAILRQAAKAAGRPTTNYVRFVALTHARGVSHQLDTRKAECVDGLGLSGRGREPGTTDEQAVKVTPRMILLAMVAAIVGALTLDEAGISRLDDPETRWTLAESVIEDARRLCGDENGEL